MEKLLSIVQTINMYLSDYILIILLIGVGLFFTIKTKFVQVRCFGEGMRQVFGNLSLKGCAVIKRFLKNNPASVAINASLGERCHTLAIFHSDDESGNLISYLEHILELSRSIIRDLFFNTPARMKFMKSDTVEGSKVAAAIQMQALAHPEVAFRFLRDNHT